MNPFTRRRKVSVRIRNHETAMAKVNDADGNPIEIAAVVVWQVADTAKALYAVDDFPTFVAIQTETAVRHSPPATPTPATAASGCRCATTPTEITSRAVGRDRRPGRPGRGRGDRVAADPAVVCAEIAQAMLRQQQANAVVGARRRIVEGAVGMVQLALQRLKDEGVVELDEERKAAMVSNLLVVLCSEQATQQVVNTGSLYQ